ncbi:hypothetical protein BGX28_007589 [Mortierella sp. GBA30]|nr:hypothetical protein BGX28_007589 [Mortierella sp. GBA30]
MFKKRTPAKKSDDEDNEDAAITVSIPQDAFNLPSPTINGSRRDSAEKERTSFNSTRRSSIDTKQLRQPHQPWKPWNPQKMTTHSTNRGSDVSTGTAFIASPALSTLSSPSSSSSTPTATKKNSPGMMLNVSAMFSGGSNTATTTTTTTTTLASNSTSAGKNKTAVNNSSTSQQQQQPVEAQLWNAEQPDSSPLSPAGPRYIPAIAGRGAAPRMGFGTGLGRMNPRSGENTGRSAGQSSASLHTAMMGERSHHRGTTKTSSFKSRTGYIPSIDGSKSGPSSPAFHQYPLSPGMSKFSEMKENVHPGHMRSTSEGTRCIKEHRAGAGDVHIADNPLETSWSGAREASASGFGADTADDSNRDDDLIDAEKDRYPSHPSYSHHSRYPLLFSDPVRVLRTRIFCLRKNRRLHPCVRLIVLLFLAGSVCFTTLHLVLMESKAAGGNDSGGRRALRTSFDFSEQQLRIRNILGHSKVEQAMSMFDVEAQNYSTHQWALDTYDINNSKAVARVSEDYMLSKAFSGAMQPTRVIPFYFRASFKDENDDDDLREDEDVDQGGDHDENGSDFNAVQVDPSLVTITTLITPDRYGVFLKLVRQYRGPISVATHIRTGVDQDKAFQELHDFFREHSILRKYVDLHVVVDGVDFQLNMWRNVARMFARTAYFMMLDVDFHIPSGLKNHLHHDPRIQELLSSGAALVVPAFEYTIDHDPKDSKYFPDKKADLIPLIEKGHIAVFHDAFPPGHAATDTPRWIKMSQPASDSGSRWTEVEKYLEQEAEGERPYKVTNFEPKYEPYIILKREGTPWCDERFVGYGANKAQEICFVTLERMIATGEWYTSKANNLRHQCNAFEGFLKSADQMAQDYELQHPGSLLEEPVFVTERNIQKKRIRLQATDHHRQGKEMTTENGGEDSRKGGMRHGEGKVALGQQIVDDEEHHDPFMSRPRGRIWGGVQPKTYYVPPPPEDDIPIDGIDVDSAIEIRKQDTMDDEKQGGDNQQQHQQQQQQSSGELTGETLELYRQGIILPNHEGDHSRFAFPKDGEDTESSVYKDLQRNDNDPRNRTKGRYDDEDAEDQDQNESQREGQREVGSLPESSLPAHTSQGGSFEDSAEQLEEHYRQLGPA